MPKPKTEKVNSGFTRPCDFCGRKVHRFVPLTRRTGPAVRICLACYDSLSITNPKRKGT